MLTGDTALSQVKLTRAAHTVGCKETARYSVFSLHPTLQLLVASGSEMSRPLQYQRMQLNIQYIHSVPKCRLDVKLHRFNNISGYVSRDWMQWRI